MSILIPEVHYVDNGKPAVTFEPRKYEFFKFAPFFKMDFIVCAFALLYKF